MRAHRQVDVVLGIATDRAEQLVLDPFLVCLRIFEGARLAQPLAIQVEAERMVQQAYNIVENPVSNRPQLIVQKID